MRRLINSLPLLGLLLALYTPLPAVAKTSDAEQPVHIEADSVEIREKDGLSIYRGHVKITRGSMNIQGELIHIHSNDDGLEKITVQGDPARFSQLNDANQEVSAESGDMNYDADSGILVLKKDAILIQHQNRFTSQHIIYDTRKDVVKAGNSPPTSSNDGTEQTPSRVTITIKPKTSNAGARNSEETP